MASPLSISLFGSFEVRLDGRPLRRLHSRKERQAREHAYLSALEALAEHAMAAGEPAEAQRYLQRVTAVDPVRESAHRALMRACAGGGNFAAALQTYRDLRLRLHRELN